MLSAPATRGATGRLDGYAASPRALPPRSPVQPANGAGAARGPGGSPWRPRPPRCPLWIPDPRRLSRRDARRTGPGSCDACDRPRHGDVQFRRVRRRPGRRTDIDIRRHLRLDVCVRHLQIHGHITSLATFGTHALPPLEEAPRRRDRGLPAKKSLGLLLRSPQCPQGATRMAELTGDPCCTP
jgi:hypothetical protein